MPELPEVEVSRMGITPHLLGQVIKTMTFRAGKLRWPIPEELKQLQGCTVDAISRRAKYLIIETKAGCALVHLGMSGSLRVIDIGQAAGKHDHVDMVMENGKVLRYNDPRRFGAWLWCEVGEQHTVLSNLGPEPLSDDFHAQRMQEKASGRRVAVKQFVMDNKVVVGVGNIYANESLFTARIHPTRPANTLSAVEWQTLVFEIKQVLTRAIAQGGTSLKDFAQVDGKPGYFVQELNVYGKAKQPCPNCGEEIEEQKIAQRNTFFCSVCQH
ncbi:bifunctional DNA-formamidopyrimidine glycosylase/DNA-(apurinic or apyrimidinic site) lyase [Vibrio profundum]|uniref:bifunctional DNA-formamidopyrimidine glycosylase/DNA-(apurinic or apyrimidinic site) lyase n=1 Tax=Vibrio profundum TaxID=2910247 RepID=UPI003D10EAB5